ENSDFPHLRSARVRLRALANREAERAELSGRPGRASERRDVDDQRAGRDAAAGDGHGGRHDDELHTARQPHAARYAASEHGRGNAADGQRHEPGAAAEAKTAASADRHHAHHAAAHRNYGDRSAANGYNQNGHDEDRHRPTTAKAARIIRAPWRASPS